MSNERRESRPTASFQLILSTYSQVREDLLAAPRTWLVTGAAGFIGSHLVEELLRLRQEVVGLDNLSTGFRSNLDAVRREVGDEAWSQFSFIEGDICDLETARAACEGVDYVLHQAALGSVPRSVADPLATHASNLTGSVNMLVAARDAKVRRFVFAASSSTYGDHPGLPKVEGRIGRPLSPYAVTKLANELYAAVFERTYGISTVGLRYFNVYGPRQNPEGAYAAVIPHWISSLLEARACRINGDGETSRDFTFVADAVQANILAAISSAAGISGEVFNVAVGGRTTLNELAGLIRDTLQTAANLTDLPTPEYVDFREGDVRHSQADISKIAERLGYRPATHIEQGIEATVRSYLAESNQVAST